MINGSGHFGLADCARRSAIFVPRRAIAGCILPVIPFAPCPAARSKAKRGGEQHNGREPARVLPHVRVRPPGEACGAVARQRPAHADRLTQRATYGWSACNSKLAPISRFRSACTPNLRLRLPCGICIRVFRWGSRAAWTPRKHRGVRSRPSPRWPHMHRRNRPRSRGPYLRIGQGRRALCSWSGTPEQRAAGQDDHRTGECPLVGNCTEHGEFYQRGVDKLRVAQWSEQRCWGAVCGNDQQPNDDAKQKDHAAILPQPPNSHLTSSR